MTSLENGSLMNGKVHVTWYLVCAMMMGCAVL